MINQFRQAGELDRTSGRHAVARDLEQPATSSSRAFQSWVGPIQYFAGRIPPCPPPRGAMAEFLSLGGAGRFKASTRAGWRRFPRSLADGEPGMPQNGHADQATDRSLVLVGNPAQPLNHRTVKTNAQNAPERLGMEHQPCCGEGDNRRRPRNAQQENAPLDQMCRKPRGAQARRTAARRYWRRL
jgi:hypothetical protein